MWRALTLLPLLLTGASSEQTPSYHLRAAHGRYVRLTSKALATPFTRPQGQEGEGEDMELPLDLSQVTDLLNVLPDRALAGQITKRGISFKLASQILDDLTRHGAGPQTISVLKSFLSNHPPSVTLTTAKPIISLGDRLEVTADANDPDGDSLIYKWSVTDGDIRGTGPRAVLYTNGVRVGSRPLQIALSVTVWDRRGGAVTGTKNIKLRGANSHIGEAMSVSARSEGKDILVHLTGSEESPSGTQGVIEIVIRPDALYPSVKSHSGNFPGVSCRVDFRGVENVGEYSFKEPPGVTNGWGEAVLRIRPKDKRRAVRFLLGWQVLGGTEPR